MSDHQAEREVQEEGGGKLAWFVTGAVIGLALGVLYAPKSGKQTREFISQKTQEGRDAVTETTRDIFDRSRDIYTKGRQLVDDATELFERGRKLVRG